MKRKIVLASRNPDKVRELRQLCADLPFEVLSARDFPGLPEVIEDGTTILGNASRKALATAAYTGEIAVADDTSLQVRELNGWPDIFAARFSGPGATYAGNAELVLELLQGVPAERRQARFATACVWVDPRPARPDLQAPPPARQRWLRNPWLRPIEIRDTDAEWDFWNGLLDRRVVWAEYRRRMESDLGLGGHDAGRLAEVAAALLESCPDAARGRRPAAPGAGLRLPDPRLWAVGDPRHPEPAPTRVAPGGLDREAPGRGVNQELWCEIAAEGRLLGTINRQPVGGGGFGYDPVFVPAGDDRTLAELPAELKNAVSHRGRAFRRLMAAVRAAYGA